MEHAEAMDTGAAEKYALGQMKDEERDQYEEHFFDCPDCADEVREATLFLENAQAVAREQVEERGRARAPGLLGSWKTLFWPMPLGAAAALVLLLGGPAAYQALVTVPRLEQAVAAGEALRLAPSYFLRIARSERPVVRVKEGEPSVVLTLSRSSDESFPFYRCEVVDAGGRSVLSSVVPAPAARDELQLLLHTGGLAPGDYVLTVAGLESASARAANPPMRYHFTLERFGPGA